MELRAHLSPRQGNPDRRRGATFSLEDYAPKPRRPAPSYGAPHEPDAHGAAKRWHRAHLRAAAWSGRRKGWRAARHGDDPPTAADSRWCWARPASSPTVMVNNVLPYHGAQPLELAILSLSSFLFAWVSLGILDGGHGLPAAVLGTRSSRHHPIRGARDAAVGRRAHRGRHADLQRGRGARVRGTAGHLRVGRPGRHPSALRLLRAQRQYRAGHADAPSGTPGATCARASTGSAGSSTAGGDTASSARAATSPTSAAAGGASTGTWSSWTRTA